jgi:hypothetical protein
MASLRVSNLRGRSDGESPTLPDGGVVTGVLTATSFSGNGSGLIGVASTDNIITGTASTFNNLVNVGSNIKIDATSGIVTATSFVGGAENLTGLPAGFSELDAALFN